MPLNSIKQSLREFGVFHRSTDRKASTRISTEIRKTPYLKTNQFIKLIITGNELDQKRGNDSRISQFYGYLSQQGISTFCTLTKNRDAELMMK